MVPTGRILKIMRFKIISLTLEERTEGFCYRKKPQVSGKILAVTETAWHFRSLLTV